MSFTTTRYAFEDALRLMAEVGYKGIELCEPDIRLCKTDEMRRQVAEHISSFGLSLVRYNVAAADYFGPLNSREDSRPVLEGLMKDIDIAASLGVRQLLTWEGLPPKACASEDIHGWILEETVGIFREAVDYAKHRDISISVEVHPYTLGIDLDFLTKLCDSLDPDYFGVTYDCAHFGVGLPDGYIQAIRRLGGRIKHLHFSDSDKRSSEVHFPLGKGCLDLDGIVEALKEVGFSGTVMLDTWLYPLALEASRVGVPYLAKVARHLGIND